MTANRLARISVKNLLYVDSFYLSVTDFSLAHTVECGQVFRWKKTGQNQYEGIVESSIIRIQQVKNRLIIHTSDSKITPSFIKSYFDLALDLPYIYNKIGKDKHIKTAIERFRGLRIIRQPLWECLASFIVSTNNNIPRIKNIITNICKCFGKPLMGSMGREYYSFPDARLFVNSTPRQLERCGTGYRADYLMKSAQVFLEKRLNAEILEKMPYKEAKDYLMKNFHGGGVGDKVADCTLLFSINKFEAFPIDVWIKRIMEKFYFEGRQTDKKRIRAFAIDHFGKYAGYAQQYLFYYGREKGIK